MSINTSSTKQFKLMATIMATIFSFLMFGVAVWAAQSLNMNTTCNVAFIASSVSGQVNSELDGGYIAPGEETNIVNYYSGIEKAENAMVLDADYYMLNNVCIWKTGDWIGKKVYKLVEGKYIPATATTILEAGTFSASTHSNGTISFNPGDTLNSWNLNTVEFQENPVNTITPILMSFTIKNTGDTLMGISISEISDTMRSNISSNGYDSDNFTAQYKVDAGYYNNFTSNDTGIIKCLAKNECTTIIVKYAVLQDTISIENLATSFKFNFGKSVGVTISDPLVLNSKPSLFNGEEYNTTLSTENGLILPNTVVITTNDDIVLTAGSDYTYTLGEGSTSATLSILENKVFNNLHITCNSSLIVTPTLVDTTMKYNGINRASGIAFIIPRTADFVATLTTTTALNNQYFHDIAITMGGTNFTGFDIVKSFSDTTLITTLTIPIADLTGEVFITVNCHDSWNGTSTDLTEKGWTYVDLKTDFELNNNLYLNDERFIDKYNGYVQITDGINTIYVGNAVNNMGIYYIDTLGTLAIEHVEGTTNGHYYVSGKTLNYRTGISGTFSTVNIWDPIGVDSRNLFTGHFNANNKIISGLYINNALTRQGLFGYLDESASINGVGVVNSYVKGGNFTSVICGYNFGYGNISNCYNAGILCGNEYVGGLCGWNSRAALTNCYNAGSISGSSYTGGVCGLNNAIVDTCYNLGSVQGINKVGGLVGGNQGLIGNSYNTGTITGVEGGDETGGISGKNSDMVRNCFNKGNVSGAGYTGGLCGFSQSRICNSYNIGNLGDSGFAGSLCGNTDFRNSIVNCNYLDTTCPQAIFNVAGCVKDVKSLTATEMKNYTNFETWDMVRTWKINDGEYPSFQIKADYITYTLEDTLWYTNGEPYNISSIGQFAYLAHLVNNGIYNFSGKTINLVQDIIMPNIPTTQTEYISNVINGTFKQWNAIGTEQFPFEGTFDGNNHTISHLYINNNVYNQGLFGYLGTGSTVTRIGIINSIMKGGRDVGGVSGMNKGTISNSYNTTDDISGNYNIGGICGVNCGIVINCNNAGNLNTSNDASSDIGGICGGSSYGSKTINCYNTGNLSSSAGFLGGVSGSNLNGLITNCYNLGSVSGLNGTGGISGYNGGSNGLITNCYNMGIAKRNGVIKKAGSICGSNMYSYLNNCYYLQVEGLEIVGIQSDPGTDIFAFRENGNLVFGEGESLVINSTNCTTLLSALQNYQIAHPGTTPNILSEWVENGNYAKFPWQ